MIVLGGDLNVYVAKKVKVTKVHGGFGYGVRNVEGEKVLEFRDAM